MDRALPDTAFLSEHKVPLRNLNLHVRVWGEPSKPLVFLQHGARDHGRSWDWTVARLLPDYCVAVPDLRGHGDSDWSNSSGYDSTDFVTDMSMVVDDLEARGLAMPFHLVGHSLGGNIALHYAAAFPEKVKTLTSIEGLGFSQRAYDEIMAKPMGERLAAVVEGRQKAYAREPRSFPKKSDAISRMRALHKNLSADQAEHLAIHALADDEGSVRWKHDPFLLMEAYRPEPPSEYGPLFGAIKAPVLLMYGLESWATSPGKDGRLGIFSNAQLMEFDDAGHWLHHDRFEDFIAGLRRFWEET